MITVQLFVPGHNRPGTAYGSYLASILETWTSWVQTFGKDGEAAYQKKTYVAAEIQSLKNSMIGDMGQSGKFTPVYSLAIAEGIGVGAFCKRGNAQGANKHKIELILSLPEGMRNPDLWPKPSPTSVLFAEAALIALKAGATLKLETENDDLVGFYNKAYGFEISGSKYGERTPMQLDGEGLAKLVGKYAFGIAWQYARALPAPP